GTTVTFGCSPSCTCGGNCLAVGAFNMEHALFAVTGGVCHCGIEVAHSVDSEIPSVVDRLSIDIPPVLLVKDSWMPGSRSAMATVSLELSSRRSGELRIWIEHGSEKVILPVGADRRMPLSNVLAWSCSFVIDGVVPSEEEGDVRVCCAFDGLRDEATTTVVSTQRVELPTAPVTGMAVLKGTGVPVAVVLNPSVEGVRVEWHTARRKRQNIYDPWICVIQGERNVIVPTPESGIFALRARLVCGTQSNQVEYVHQVDERWSNAGREFIGPNKAGMRNHFGVASTSLLLKIRKSALDQMESTAYAYAAFLPARNGFAAIPADRWKCNAFVADMAIEAGATIRPRNPVQGAISGNYFPPLANDWANGDVVIQGWEFLGRDVYPEPGFVVGFPNAQGSGHVGIVDYDGWTISARPFAVTRYARKMLDSRCGYNRPTEEENENEK
ncbi:MAG: hypothetical protein MJ249_07015, partial [Kiritimatiellae bacterium]|nr:hypothetical protein [Kiritimatiellia bacterium]